MDTRRKAIEQTLSKVPSIEDPDAELEQYTTPAGLATDVLFEAFHLDDIAGEFVVDLGTGTGILAIGAALVGAMPVYGFDIDEQAIQQARQAAQRAGASQATFEAMPVEEMAEFDADTVISNPPFGAQQRHADRPFIDAAAEVGDVCWTFHLTETMDWVIDRVESHGGEVTHRLRFAFPIPAMFAFHDEPREEFDVTVARWTTG
jgi:putative methylase